MQGQQNGVIVIPMTEAQLADLLNLVVRAAIAPLEKRISELSPSEVMGIHDAAKRAGVSATTLRGYITNGRFCKKTRREIKLQATLTQGGHYRITTGDLDEYLSHFKAHRNG